MKNSLVATLGALAIAGMLALPGGVAMAQPAANAPAPGAAKAAEMHHQRGREHHPVIRRAIRQLQHVKGELNRAPHDFKGHRAAAEQHVEQAINELHQALKADVH